MARIRILADGVRGKIAAGEVITRPASVIKELLENSLDAKAKRIEVEITNGGKDKCLVNDDGQGMDREDAGLALERYATSKIYSIDDIDRVLTLGFRGEALASIAQVSRFDMETSDGLVGTMVIAEAGIIKSIHDSARPRGTRIKVSDLFFNFPARLKFMKSASWERRLITDLIKNYALIQPGVSFYLSDGGQEILNLPAAGSTRQRIKVVYPRYPTDHLIDIDLDLGTTRITGFVSHPAAASRNEFGNIYVNSRPVKYPRIYRALLEAYQNPQSPPAFMLDIRVDPQSVDTNIHPTKSEVKFRDERYVLDLLIQTVKGVIYKKPVTVEYGTVPSDRPRAVTQPGLSQDMAAPYVAAVTTETGRAADEFWQLHETYILAQTRSGLIIVDQHVAHERIIYESIMHGRVQSQRLLFPITIELTPEEHRVYEKTKHVLAEMGIEFKEFSAHTIVIDSLPADARTNREEIAGMFGELDGLGNLIEEKSEVARVLACRGAIKAGQRLSPAEMQSLIDRLFATENPYICPHGRPIVLRWTIEELAYRFGRT
ncbi:DNA mismatch repair endonuclease MutL [candidate division WOR-3 bacterium]|nr:DNA mismatch repair endonuclease MutL [candidate division WOR-3 bacterium]